MEPVSRKHGKLVYLASPYTADPDTEAARYHAVLRAWRWLIDNNDDFNFFVPVVQSHQLCVAGHLPVEWHFWADFDRTLLSKCEQFWVLCIPGWRESVGVGAERKIAEELGLPTRFLLPDGGGYLVQEQEPAP